MSAGHHHHHHHHHIDADAGDLRVAGAVAVNVLLTVVQIIGGIVSGSIALIADAIHNLSDALSLVIALVARRIARRPADTQMTFGYGRAETVAALVNYTTLIIISLYLAWEAVWRLIRPEAVEGWIVVVVAGVALIVDLVTVLLTLSMSRESMNIHAAFLHNLADAMTSVAVIVGGTLMLLYDWRLVDPIVTLGISAYILWSALKGIGPVIRLLMMGTPPMLDLNTVLDGMRSVPGVEAVHHLRLWQVDEHAMAVEAHLEVTAPTPVTTAAVRDVLRDRFGVRHVTLEVDLPDGPCARCPLIGPPDHA